MRLRRPASTSTVIVTSRRTTAGSRSARRRWPRDGLARRTTADVPGDPRQGPRDLRRPGPAHGACGLRRDRPQGLPRASARGRNRRLRPRPRRLRPQQGRSRGSRADVPLPRGPRPARRAPGARGGAMKYLDEYRDGRVAAKIVAEIRRVTTRPWTLMEVCGGQTHSIVKHGIDRLLPGALELVHGPGCPVCGTPLEQIDKAHAIARTPGVIFTSFGDMLRVPGSQTDLLRLKSAGADVRIVYAPLDAVRIAQDNPGREVVFFAIGFETTAPANALA